MKRIPMSTIHVSRGIAALCRLAGLASLLVAGCAGYQLGTASLYRPDIRTVYVPMFESDTYRQNLGEWLTEAVVKQIERSTPYKVVADPARADSVLIGRLVDENKRVLAETINDDARNLQVELAVQVSWVDRRGESIMPNRSFSVAQQGFLVTVDGNYIPEAGPSVTSANQQIVTQIAEQIVYQMEAPW
jgi:hypothetical protein